MEKIKINKFDQIKKFYNSKTNTYEFIKNNKFLDVFFDININVNSSIIGGKIEGFNFTANNIDCLELEACNVISSNINAIHCSANKIHANKIKSITIECNELTAITVCCNEIECDRITVKTIKYFTTVA